MPVHSPRRAAAMGALLLAASALLPSRAWAESRWGADYFPNVPLITQDGKTVRFYDDVLKGKMVVVDMIYTHCKYSCPLETAKLAQVQRLLGDRVGKDIFFVSITLDPERDTPEVLKEYAQKFRARAGWTFLTGKKEDIKLISRKLGLLSLDQAPVNRDGHTPELMVGDVPTGQWMRNSAVDNPRFLAATIAGVMDGWRGYRPTGSYAQASEYHKSRGEYLFSTRCSACHAIGQGDGVGPDLRGVTQARDRAWLVRFIARPDKLLAEKDPVATALFEKYRQVTMPNLSLGPDDVEALVAWLEQGDRTRAAGAARSAATATLSR
jgi:protein SCO1